ncbi:hypothetical protein HII36_05725 [Nonomuraea sp. NN258]|uniref:hypothetical protein n=1 Tax=Nonomuraea antri TaxID=2730852 RepID=UPI001567D1FD|nr:hypothetical protein [Nonomuraea antri]NRQ31338.1 hypothetical protein [Nonomuraea antri]
MADISTPSEVVQFIVERREHPGGLRRRISTRAAAKRASELAGGEQISEPTWRRIEAGGREPEDREIVLMAVAINDLANEVIITPDDFDQRDRPAAAELFRKWIRERSRTDPALAAFDPDLTPEVLQQNLQMMLSEIRALKRVSPEQKAKMEKALLQNLGSTLDAYRTQLHIMQPE